MRKKFQMTDDNQSHSIELRTMTESNDCAPQGDTKTLPIETRPLEHKLQRQSTSSTLEFYMPEGTRTAILQDHQRLVLGRKQQKGSEYLVSADPFLSKEHAEFSRKDGVLYVNNLSSSNGTWVFGQRIQGPIALVPGCEIQMGNVVAIVTAGSTTEAHVVPHSLFFKEVRRSLHTACSPDPTPFTLLMIRSKAQPNALFFLSTLTRCLRADDYAALYSSDAVEILLRDTDEVEGGQIARDLKIKCMKDPQGNQLSLMVSGMAIGTQGYKVIRESQLDSEVTSLLKTAFELIPEREQDSPRIQLIPKARSDGAEQSRGKCGLELHSSLKEKWPDLTRVARNPMPILLLGETGVGKTQLARHLHELSGRRGAFIIADCASLTDTLIATELLGHEKNAFTGATQQRIGLFEQASGGTIFLDEIGELPKEMQKNLLTAVEGGQLRRVGGNKLIPIHVRVIAATNKNLEEMVKQGHFRLDLYERIKGWTLYIPPVRERPKEAIAELAQALLERAKVELENDRRASQESNFQCCAQGLSAASLQLFQQYPWRGNVREMYQAITKAITASRSAIVLEPSAFADLLQPENAETSSSAATSAPAIVPTIPRAPVVVPTATPKPLTPLEQQRHDFEREKYLDGLARHKGRRDLTAQYLGVRPRTFFHKLKKFNISDDEIHERIRRLQNSSGEPR